MIYAELFWGFLKVGCFSFGGAYAAIPLIRDIVLSYGWLDDEMMSYMIAVSESTPGPIMINLATYVGTTEGGLIGALIATLAVVLPSFIIILLITALLSKVIKNRWVQAFLRGVKPCMVGIILATGAWMTAQNLFAGSFTAPDPTAILLTAILAGVYFGWNRFAKKKVSPIGLILLAAVLGAVGFAI